MILDISFDTNNTYVCPDFSENNQSLNVDFGEVQIVNDVSVRIEGEVAYINY